MQQAVTCHTPAGLDQAHPACLAFGYVWGRGCVAARVQVIKHLQELGRGKGDDALSAWPSSAGSVESVFGRILSHLAAQVRLDHSTHRLGCAEDGSRLWCLELSGVAYSVCLLLCRGTSSLHLVGPIRTEIPLTASAPCTAVYFSLGVGIYGGHCQHSRPLHSACAPAHSHPSHSGAQGPSVAAACSARPESDPPGFRA